ncbi:hypothetical protein ACLOJK_027889 [Asimina triloba]
MARSSSSSCFKIIACGGDSAGENNDLERTEMLIKLLCLLIVSTANVGLASSLNPRIAAAIHTSYGNKSSTDKRRWSFRKRSTRHRVLSNTVISETTSAGSKESSTIVSNELHTLTSPTTDTEKISELKQTEEVSQPSTPAEVSLKAADAQPAAEDASENAGEIDSSLQETTAIVLQTAIRGYLAQRALCKLKNVVKVQAAVRGHLVRRQAVGTLRCVQAIVKMQALVRARRVRMLSEGSNVPDKQYVKSKTEDQIGNPLEKENSGTSENQTSYSTKKILTNGFARQPQKPLSNADSQEKGKSDKLDASSDVLQPQKPLSNADSQEKGKSDKLDASGARTDIQCEITSESAGVKSDNREVEMSSEGEENLITYSPDDFEFHPHKNLPTSDEHTSSTIEAALRQPQGGDEVSGTDQDYSAESMNVLKEASESPSNQAEVESDTISLSTFKSIFDKPEDINENPKRALKRVAPDKLETEGKKFAFVSRKSTNPTFAAVQSKFEELSSTPTSGRSIGSSYNDAVVESKLESPSSQVDSVMKKTDASMAEDLILHDPRIQIGGSECGTELSVSSTLDSPDRFESEVVHGPGASDKRNSDLNGTDDPGKVDTEDKNISYLLPNTSNSGITQPTTLEEVNESTGDQEVVESKVEQQSEEQAAFNAYTQLEMASEKHLDNLSPEGSPRSHLTVPESHGTPSSQVSVSDRKNKSDNSASSQKKRSQSAGKRSLLNQNTESTARSSVEQLPKDSKTGKRRSSFDHEPRVSSSNSIPNYMQATESARAKAQANSSPKLSPDVQDKDTYMKKRHSLPATNGKEGSPRMQRSMSQAQQNVKRNGTHSPHNATGNSRF